MTERMTIGSAEDDDSGGYGWVYAAVIHEGDRFFIVQDYGCRSCNCPEDGQGTTAVGPAATLGGLFDELHVDKDKHPKVVKEAFLNAIIRMNEDTVKATKAALGL